MIGIDLVKDCQRITSKAVNKKLYASYENMGKLTAPRDGFVKVSTPNDEEHVIDYVGRSVGAVLKRYKNPETGIKEHILSCSRFIQRMLYDKDNKSIGAIVFDNWDYPASKSMTFQVLEPGIDGRTMEILPDGSKVLYGKGQRYDGKYGIRTLGVMVKNDAGSYDMKFFGDK